MEQILWLSLLVIGASVSLSSGQYQRDRGYGYEDEPRLALAPGASQFVGDLNDQVAVVEDALIDSLVERWLNRPASRPLQGDADAPDWQEAAEELVGNQMKRRVSDNSYYFYDINSHLPANDPFGDDYYSSSQDSIIRGPVNDPQEFEARLGQLTDELNHKLEPDSPTRQTLLEELDSLNNISTRLSVFDPAELNGEPRDLVSDLESKSHDLQMDETREDREPTGLSSTTESRFGDSGAGSEYIDQPLALAGHQFVQGGAGEGRQLLGPDGTFENVQVIKTDSAIPSYCDPPNPCPIGYTERDGCLEKFTNSASFSREYQAKQKCSCDNEHSLFNCASPPLPSSSAASQQSAGVQGNSEGRQQNGSARDQDDEESASSGLLGGAGKLDTLARTIQNRFGDLASVRKLIDAQQRARLEQNQRDADLSADLDHEDEANLLVRSARKWSPSIGMGHHQLQKIQLD